MITHSALLAVMLALGCGGCSAPSHINVGDDPALFDSSFSPESLAADWRKIQAVMDQQDREDRHAQATDECRCSLSVSK